MYILAPLCRGTAEIYDDVWRSCRDFFCVNQDSQLFCLILFRFLARPGAGGHSPEKEYDGR